VAASADISDFLTSLGRASAGSIIFALPMLMTMEMWWLGFTMSPLRMLVFLTVSVPLLIGLSFFGGFKNAVTLGDHVADVFIAILVSAITATLCLWLFGLIDETTSTREIVGKIIIETVPGAIGAMLARSQLGEKSSDADEEALESSYPGELFVMGIGALFLSLNVAPTEEMILIAYKTTVLQQIVIVLVSVAIMHLFVYWANFRGGSTMEDTGFLAVLLRYTITGYMIVIGVSLAMLWFFGRMDGISLPEILSTAVVLAFPGCIGAAAARLIL
jgi:putative integral membrane protein (TIGR02587 family)